MSTPITAPTSTAASEDPMLRLCEDGYVRLTLAELRAVGLRHLISGLDEIGPAQRGEGAASDQICGFTEWISDTSPAVSIGWDWWLDVSDTFPTYRRVGPLRSNVMLIEPDSQLDLGSETSELLMAAALEELPWQEELDRQIRARYS